MHCQPFCHLGPCSHLPPTTPCPAEAVKPAGDGLALQGQLQMIAFCVFEVCVGLFWPSMMKMRASYVPEEMRSTIINYFRIPLNIFVCCVLYNVSGQPMGDDGACTAVACSLLGE